METLKTPLFLEHQKLHAKIINFNSWHMPVYYQGIKEEHLSVRNEVGIFDVSHMGEIRIKGPKSLETLQWLTTNDVSKINEGQAQYTLMTNFQGGVVDDLIIYCLKKNEDYLLCVNAANIKKDFNWISSNTNNANNDNKEVNITNESDFWSQIAIQGPQAYNVLSQAFDLNINNFKYFTFLKYNYYQHNIIIAFTGYTGEKGAEIFIPNEIAPKIWNELMESGKKYNINPIGLGARDTLRLEMSYPLYGNELNDTLNPYQANLGWIIKANNKNFIGKEKILQQNQIGLNSTLIGFKILEKGIPRKDYRIYNFNNKIIGKVTSGTFSPSLNESIGLAYIDKNYAEVGLEFFLEIRNKKIKAKIVKTPFINKNTNEKS